MFIRALASFFALPGIFAVILPPVLAYFDPWKKTTWAPGLLAMVIGAAVLLWCVRDFYVIGKGTLAPWDPPKRLVVRGLYRYTRNPMYIGVLVLVLGWCLYYQSPLLALYLILMAVAFHIRVVANEEPWLQAQFGNQWEQYRKAIPRWLPHIRHFHS